MEKIIKEFQDYNVSGLPFRPCITNGLWFIMRWEVIYTDTKKRSIYILGTDGVDLTLYTKQHKDFPLEDLALAAVTNHIEDSDGKVGFYRFEFDGERFEYCEEKPKWAEYDCGIIKE